MAYERIDDHKLLLKASQAVWAANKYFVLACDQNAYREIRQLLRPDVRELTEAYRVMKTNDETYQTTPSAQLPELANALYHMAGYFKRVFSSEQRQAMNALIKADPAEALAELETAANTHHVDYLIHSRVWPREREKPFNHVPVPLKHKGSVYEASELLWEGDHLLRHL